MKNNYILITPAKNEERTLKKVVDSVKNQSIKPIAWVIVNDGSKDNTGNILKKETKNEKWIYVLEKTINKNYNWLGYSKVINAGVDYINKLIKERKIKNNFNFIGILDSDITLEKNYFKNLINYLNNDKNIGSISGDILSKFKNKWIAENDINAPWGGARLYNYKYFLDIGGFPKTPSPDTVSDIKLMKKGYKAVRIPEIKAYQHRLTFGRGNKIKGAFLTGRSRYVLNYNFIHVFLTSVKMCFKSKPYFLSGIFMFFGYITGFLTKTKRIYDKDVVEYKRFFLNRLFNN